VSGEPATATFPALGTTALVVVDRPGAVDEATELLRAALEDIDLACSRFRDDSELSRVNAAAGEVVEVGELLTQALAVALRAAEMTGGDVDPTVGRAMDDLGYDRDFRLMERRGPSWLVRVEPAPGWRSVLLDPRTRRVRIPRGVALDLGATAKALAADRAAATIAGAIGAGALVGLGGDIAVAGPAPAEGWPIRVVEDHRHPEAEGQTVAIRGGGLATSSTTVRRWTAGHAEQHHIVDPRRGGPASEIWRTVTVAAPTCVEANIASTAAIVRGRDATRQLERRALPARLVRAGGGVVRVCRWPREGA
jgi:thiamine biosynthesis lipoprotein